MIKKIRQITSERRKKKARYTLSSGGIMDFKAHDISSQAKEKHGGTYYEQTEETPQVCEF